MGGGKGSSESNTQLENAQVTDANALTALAQQQGANSQQLFNTTFPGLQTAANFESVLASGDPAAIARQIAPATQQIQSATAGAKANILNTSPAGGARDLAIQNADVSQGAQVGSLASQGFLQAPGALAQLAGQGVSQGISSAGTAISGYGQSSNALGGVVQENIQQKGATLGAFGGLAGDAASLGSAGISSAGTKGAAALLAA